MSRGDVNQQTNQSINNNPSMHCSAAKDAKEICCAAVKKARRENHSTGRVLEDGSISVQLKVVVKRW